MWCRVLFIVFITCHYAECLYAECRYGECHYAEFRGTKLNANTLDISQN